MRYLLTQEVNALLINLVDCLNLQFLASENQQELTEHSPSDDSLSVYVLEILFDFRFASLRISRTVVEILSPQTGKDSKVLLKLMIDSEISRCICSISLKLRNNCPSLKFQLLSNKIEISLERLAQKTSRKFVAICLQCLYLVSNNFIVLVIIFEQIEDSKIELSSKNLAFYAESIQVRIKRLDLEITVKFRKRLVDCYQCVEISFGE